MKVGSLFIAHQGWISVVTFKVLRNREGLFADYDNQAMKASGRERGVKLSGVGSP